MARPPSAPAMPDHRLPDHLGVCEVDGRILMLDLRRDRYLELDPGSASVLRRWRQGNADLEADPGFSQLVERGMLVPAESYQAPRWTETKVPAHSLLGRTSTHGAPWAAVPEVAATLWSTRRRLRRKGLEAAVNEVRRRKAAAAAGDPLPYLARFRAARRLVPLAPNCLVDSLSLSALLCSRGVRCDLVFGVKLEPFAAHCWLQNDDAVLNDAADSVSTFTPILVV